MTANYLTAVIPLFVFMGELAYLSGLTREAYSATYRWLGRLPGGLAMATIGGCAGFAAVCGSSEATALTIGSFALPEMRKHKYDPRLALGSIAAGGTLGILIPPSMALVLYGLITEQSIGKLFLAGVLPGILLACLFIGTIYVLAKFNPLMGPAGAETSWREKLSAIKDIWGVLILFLVVMGGIYGGILTPTEAAAAGAFSAFLIALRGKLTRQNLAVLHEHAQSDWFVFVIIIGAVLFGYFMAASGVSTALADLSAFFSTSFYFDIYPRPLPCPGLSYGCLCDGADYHAHPVPPRVGLGLRPDLVWCAHRDHDGDGDDHSAHWHECVCD
jgi:tripartite ATP-independent transporter DctM subunit